jgi:copper chaperone CopZ
MKIKFALAATVIAGAMSFGSAFACPDHDGEKTAKVEQKDVAPPAHMATASFHVDGMHCAGCIDEVQGALAKLDGVVKVNVTLADKRVTVSYDADKLKPDTIAKTMSDAGFKAAAEV